MAGPNQLAASESQVQLSRTQHEAAAAESCGLERNDTLMPDYDKSAIAELIVVREDRDSWVPEY